MELVKPKEYWSSVLLIKNKKLSLVYDRGSLAVTKGSGEVVENLFPKDKNLFSVTAEGLADEINDEFV